MNDRIRRLTEEARDSLRFHKFIRYCQMEGLGSADAEDDRYYSESQERFFEQYEAQLDPLLYALASVVGTENRLE